MDDLAHDFHPLNRKRKADQDDCPSSHCQPQDGPPSVEAAAPCDSMLVDPAATPRCPANSPDRSSTASWLLAADTDVGIVPAWQQPLPSPPPAHPFVAESQKEGPSKPKRPRIEIPQAPSSPRRARRRFYSPALSSPARKLIRRSRTHDTRDTGIVSATEPGPSRGSLLRICTLPTTPRPSSSVPVSPIETFSPHIPSHQPPINRETLKELDLEAILRNPQLRHDLLFDSGLQFRPTSSRRKRDMAENYWIAIVRELECGCTCFTVDAHGRPCERMCICSSLPLPTGRPICAFANDNRCTVRTPSRIRPLLLELLEVLVSIIQPVMSKTTGLCVQPTALHPQYQQNVAHVALLRSVLDADLIQQEIDHGLFDPSGVFQTIGDIIRCHCAPMRDGAVDQMVALAKSCAPGGGGSKVEAVRAIRLCFEIMELMKLDVANHQLQTLRPYLVQSAAQYELKTFHESKESGRLCMDVTREWLRVAHRDLSARQDSFTLNTLPSSHFTKLPRRTQIDIAVTAGLVDLVFNPPPRGSSSQPPYLSPRPTAPGSPARYPETLYLDQARVSSYAKDAADFAALYMLLLLYRQLVLSGQQQGHVRLALDDLLRLKKEIWEVGPTHLGLCFRPPKDTGARGEAETKRWKTEMEDVVLQVTRRAGEVRCSPPNSAASASTSSQPAASPSVAKSSTPDAQLTKLATSWAESNLRADSSLSTLMRRRVRDAVFRIALPIVVPSLKRSEPHAESETSSGLEPLMPEVQHLGERIAKLAGIHLNVYGALYAQPGFLAESAGAIAASTNTTTTTSTTSFPAAISTVAPATT
ncbi:Tcp11-domain-containing protein [Rhodofomes roseus]|uniref:Tcp11-domain-containing protein n=1 Tax=Rhodofomes roseus TaxID=34475 RepID=A0ABQ8KRX0_9APHY|nr:Tcp11-domain-containing protein [Rhodofomes roseus]KAH9841551.1 Tcp11-domain-containing protein [Rhodofomes roseus]